MTVPVAGAVARVKAASLVSDKKGSVVLETRRRPRVVGVAGTGQA
jgi:hypothetical protein